MLTFRRSNDLLPDIVNQYKTHMHWMQHTWKTIIANMTFEQAGAYLSLLASINAGSSGRCHPFESWPWWAESRSPSDSLRQQAGQMRVAFQSGRRKFRECRDQERRNALPSAKLISGTSLHQARVTRGQEQQSNQFMSKFAQQSGG